jgi:ABC-type Mn2+/Zn2+ transport system ATPase subunit
MIKIENVSFNYGGEDNILKNINLDIEEGELLAIIGKNGSRKIYFSKISFWIAKAQ